MENLTFDTFFPAFMLTLLAGLSTGIGAALAFFSKADNTKFLSVGLGFSAGMMVYISFMEILVQSEEAFRPSFGAVGGEAMMLLCFFGGFVLMFIIDLLIPEDVNPHDIKNDRELSGLKSEGAERNLQRTQLHRTGIFTALAIGIHNFPEGFATFVSALHDLSLGIPIALAIALHNIPEGMAVSLPIYQATGNRKRAFYYAFGSGLAEPLGAIIGFFLLLPIMGDLTLGIMFGVIAGIMVYISFDELLPAARVYGNAHTTIFGLALGMFVIALSLLLFRIV
jgi:zinc transporter, ZIP family